MRRQKQQSWLGLRTAPPPSTREKIRWKRDDGYNYPKTIAQSRIQLVLKLLKLQEVFSFLNVNTKTVSTNRSGLPNVFLSSNRQGSAEG